MFADSRFDYLSRLRYYASMVVTPVHYVASMPGRALDSMLGTVRTRDELAAENARLQEQLLMQQFQLQKLEHMTAENTRLNELLKGSSIVEEEVVRAQLIGESPDLFAKRVLINKGSTDGVYIGQPVLDAAGLMGQVMEVEALTSWVLLITDPQHATPVQINRNGIRAIAAGTRDSLHQLTLNNMPNTADIQEGDLLVTSGLGERFPEGYPVGVVKSIYHDPGKPFADVLVTPTAQIDRSRNLGLVFENRTQRRSSPAASVSAVLTETVSGEQSLIPAQAAEPVQSEVIQPDPAPATQEQAAEPVVDIEAGVEASAEIEEATSTETATSTNAGPNAETGGGEN
jgi:rod shape-determining protein MreC